VITHTESIVNSYTYFRGLMGNTVWWMKCREEGMKEGRKEGRKEGGKEGRKEGREFGTNKK
jgi:predicted transposase YdaD